MIRTPTSLIPDIENNRFEILTITGFSDHIPSLFRQASQVHEPVGFRQSQPRG